jgi:acyl-homoserine lactone acylase PvdQ
MTLAHFYGYKVREWSFSGKVKKRPSQLEVFSNPNTYISERYLIELFELVVNDLIEDFGTWKMPWGEVNRYQRLNGDIRQAFNDSLPSVGVGFASGTWGALAAYGARYNNNTKKIYGTRGNSFAAVVEFGDKVKAKTILAGGQSGDPKSPHFDDQTERYINMDWKEAAYYKGDVLKRAQNTYRPGESNSPNQE